MRLYLLIFLALHPLLFIYPVLRLGDWFDLGLLTILFILIPTASAQIVSRWLYRKVQNRWTRQLRVLADFWLGISPILLITLLVFEVVTAIGLLPDMAAAWWVVSISAGVTMLGLLAAIVPTVRPVIFTSAKLKAPVRFVQITDVHIGSRSARFLSRVVKRIRQLQPDFVCVTGDLVDASGVTEDDLRPLGNLGCPVYFCIGNHERYEDLDDILARLRRLGVRVLRTESDYVREDIQIIGVDDRDDANQVERELSQLVVDPRTFGILLYHRPKGLEAAAAAGIDLMLSGHTHNGQIFPFNLIVGRFFSRIVGLYHSGATRLYVSQGTGTWGPVMRVGTRSEITLFELTV